MLRPGLQPDEAEGRYINEVLASLDRRAVPSQEAVPPGYGRSATEQEIFRGLLYAPGAASHTLILMRDEMEGRAQPAAETQEMREDRMEADRLRRELQQYMDDKHGKVISIQQHSDGYLQAAYDFLERIVLQQIAESK